MNIGGKFRNLCGGVWSYLLTTTQSNDFYHTWGACQLLEEIIIMHIVRKGGGCEEVTEYS